jgi:two-component system chemotaxis response regulator CheY
MKFCLIVDDSDIIRKVARKIVESAGHIAIEAANAEDALELCRKSMPHMILLNWKQPGLSSLDFLAELRELTTVDFPDVLFAVTEADPQLLTSAYRAGIRKHILKPFSKQNLIPALAEMSNSAEETAKTYA